MSIFSVHIIRQKYVKNEKHFQMTIHDSGYKVWHYLSFKKIPVKKKLQRNTSKEKLKIESLNATHKQLRWQAVWNGEKKILICIHTMIRANLFF